jgi:hypothetical protein
MNCEIDGGLRQAYWGVVRSALSRTPERIFSGAL